MLSTDPIYINFGILSSFCISLFFNLIQIPLLNISATDTKVAEFRR